MKTLKLISVQYPDLVLELAKEKDIENLRIWKNANRRSFFYQEEISAKEQEKWFASYQKRTEDYMFIVKEVTKESADAHSIGCLAFRVEDERTIDLYNIIRGQKSKGTASMRNAMYVMLNFIKENYPEKRIKCDVLKDNPAVFWYQKCGFAIWKEMEYYIMDIDKKDIPAVKIIVSKEE